MTKRKTKKKQTHNKKRKNTKKPYSNIKIINILLAIVVILMSVITYIVFTNDSNNSTIQKNEIIKKPIKQIQKIDKSIEKEIESISKELEVRKDKFEEYTKEFYEEYVEKIEHKNDIKKQIEKPIKIDKKPLIKIEEKKDLVKKEKQVFASNKPKLVIIIDDVTTQYQLNKIKDLGYKVTPSIMPPTPSHPDSALIAKDLAFYMIHFPLEAKNFNASEKYTLRTIDSYEKIEKRVAQVRQWYPDALYTNNHTGSKFTSNKQSMDYLLKALKKHNFIFMDSRTTAKTAVKSLVGKYDMPYIARNIFIDNKKDFNYIQTQLKKAVKLAKKNGYSIAIGHPHAITMETLKKSKDLFKGLDLVYLNELPYLQ